MNYEQAIAAKQAMGFASGQVGYASDMAAKREREIPAGVNRVESNLGALCSFVDDLDNRLTAYIARPHAPVAEPKGQLRGAMASGLGGQLDGIAERIEVAARRIEDLLQRLEA